ncbi:MAG: serine/threonine protein kinase, partial [bacterium]|nr:serine/threonine protein kinase [bacterium]
MAMVGQTIANFQILEKLGEGGMGVVYKARDLKLSRFVALKFLHSRRADEEERHRFIHEAQAASALDHPNICTVHQVGETEEGQMFLAMAYYEGETLEEKIDGGPLAVEEATAIALQIASGLAKAHA